MLPRGERLRSGRDFALAYSRGTVYHEERISLHVFLMSDQPGDRLVGFAVGKKVGNAVVRNLVRRRLRHAVRGLSLRAGLAVMLVFTARPGADRATFGALRAAVERALGRAGLLASTESPSLATIDAGESRE